MIWPGSALGFRCSWIVIVLAFTLTGCPPSNPNNTTTNSSSVDQGNIENTPEPCNSFLSSSALSIVCQALQQLSGSCGITPPTCSNQAQELYAGSSLQLPKDNSSTEWNNMGGAGKSLSDAAVCLLSDLSKGAKTNEADAQLLGLTFSTIQTIGFISFDPVAKVFQGYQRVQVCMPVVGCFDAKIQGIKAQANLNDPAYAGGLDLHADGFPIAKAYGLVLTLEQSDEGFSASAPAITIATPYGNISVQPGIAYSSHMGTTIFQAADDVLVDMDTWLPQVVNVLGTNAGALMETHVESAALPGDTGWVSQAGIGSRQASHPNDPIWTGGFTAPRPDIQNMTLARTADELKPVSDYSVRVPIQYSPPLPFIVPPLQADFDVVVQPQVEIRYSSTLEAEFAQWWSNQADNVTNPDGSIIFKSRAEALASFSLSTGIDLTITASIGGLGLAR